VAFSVRSPNTTDESVPTDWQFSTGLESKYLDAEYERERELGLYHYAVDMEGTINARYVEVKGSTYKKTSRAIDTQKIGLSWPPKHWFQIGTIRAYDTWQNPEQRLSMNLSISGLKAFYETRFQGTESAGIEFSKPIATKDLKSFKIKLIPLIKYRREQDIDSWQAKLKVSFSRN
jgi:hypothetical protein